MKVAVITPYYKEPRTWLERCLLSVAGQRHAATHIVVADGHPQDWIDELPVRHLKLDQAHGDYGNTPRAVGAMLAASEGFDAVCFLDADNALTPTHVESCVALAAADPLLDYVTTRRHMVREDGSIIPLRIREDHDNSHVDTNCFFLLRGAMHTLARWALMPRPMAVYGDRVYLASLREEGLRSACTEERSVLYLCTWAHLYREVGEPAPAFAKEPLPLAQLPRWYAGLPPREREVTQRLSGMACPVA
ncbi:MAG: glycosyltransferase [Proteobacteria bacterium]|nr:glycosyltransferase [Pseudomonadota bacterium]